MKFSAARQYQNRLLFPIALTALGVITALAGKSVQGQAADTMPSYQPDASIAEIMDSIVMPSADALWNAVVVNYTQDGLEESKPETDEDWAKLRWSAVNLAEATNLLQMPNRHVAPPGTEPAQPGYELTPDQMQALIDGNRTAWMARAIVLHDIALQTISIIDKHDVDGLAEIGGAIDEACESCHMQFWYPDQK